MSSQSPFTDRTLVVSGGSRGTVRSAADSGVLASAGGDDPILDIFVDRS